MNLYGDLGEWIQDGKVKVFRESGETLQGIINLQLWITFPDQKTTSKMFTIRDQKVRL